MIINCTFGPLVINLRGTNALVLEIAKDLDRIDKDINSGNPDIELSFESDEYSINETHYSGKKTLYFNNDEICINTNPFYKAYLKGLFSENTTYIRIVQKKQSVGRRFINFIKRFISSEYPTKESQLRKHICNYSFLWSVFSIKLLEKNCAFLHSGVFSKQGKTIVVAGTGGCGKTSTVINACKDLGFYFLSEDFGIVSSDGKAFYSPKTISLYKSDFKYYPSLELEVIGRFNFFHRLKWKVLANFLKRNPIVKISPTDVFQSTKIERITDVYFFQRLNKDPYSVTDIDLNMLIERICWASYREIFPFLTVLCSISANKDSSQAFNTPEEVRVKMLNIYRSAFESSRNKLFSCSLSENPLDIMRVIDEP